MAVQMTMQQIRFEVNAEMEQEMEQRKYNLEKRIKDASDFQTRDEIAKFQKMELLKKENTQEELKILSKEQGILLELPAIQRTIDTTQIVDKEEPIEDSSDIELVDHSEIERVSLQQELEYLKNRALMEKEDQDYELKLEQAERAKEEYLEKKEDSRFELCKELVYEYIEIASGRLDKTQAKENFEEQICSIEHLLPKYDGGLTVVSELKKELLENYLKTGNLLNEAVANSTDVFDFEDQILEEYCSEEQYFSLNDEFACGYLKREFPFIRLICHDESLKVEQSKVQKLCGEKLYFNMAGTDDQEVEAYKEYFTVFYDSIKELNMELKNKEEKEVDAEERVIELDEELMIFPIVEPEKFLKNPTTEQIILSRINFLIYKYCDLANYFVFELVQFQNQAPNKNENQFVKIKYLNKIQDPIQISVYQCLKQVKQISELEQLFSFIILTKIKINEINGKIALNEEGKDTKVVSTPRTTHNAKKQDNEDPLRAQYDLNVKQKFETVNVSDFDQIIYISKRATQKLVSAQTQKAQKSKEDSEQAAQFEDIIKQATIFGAQELADISVVEVQDDSFQELKAFYRQDDVQLLEIKEDALLQAIELRFDAGCAEELLQMKVDEDYGARMADCVTRHVQKAIGRGELVRSNIELHLSEQQKKYIIGRFEGVLVEELRARQQEKLFSLSLLLRILYQVSNTANISLLATILLQFAETQRQIEDLTPQAQFSQAQQTLLEDCVHEMHDNLIPLVREQLTQYCSVPSYGAAKMIAEACELPAVAAVADSCDALLSKYFQCQHSIQQFSLVGNSVQINDVITHEIVVTVKDFLFLASLPYLLSIELEAILFGNSQGVFTKFLQQFLILEQKINERDFVQTTDNDIFSDILFTADILKESKALQNSIIDVEIITKEEISKVCHRVKRISQHLYLLSLQAIQDSGEKSEALIKLLDSYKQALLEEQQCSMEELKKMDEFLTEEEDTSVIRRQFEHQFTKSLLVEIPDIKQYVLQRVDDEDALGAKIEENQGIIDEIAQFLALSIKTTTSEPDTNPKAKKGSLIEQSKYDYYTIPLYSEIEQNISELSVQEFDLLISTNFSVSTKIFDSIEKSSTFIKQYIALFDEIEFEYKNELMLSFLPVETLSYQEKLYRVFKITDDFKLIQLKDKLCKFLQFGLEIEENQCIGSAIGLFEDTKSEIEELLNGREEIKKNKK